MVVLKNGLLLHGVLYTVFDLVRGLFRLEVYQTAGVLPIFKDMHDGVCRPLALIAGVFAGCNPYVASTKSMTGHEMWMAGASEVVYSMLMMRHGFIAPNINFTEGDEATSKLNIPVRRVDTEFDCFLSNSFGFGGTNSTLIVKKYK